MLNPKRLQHHNQNRVLKKSQSKNPTSSKHQHQHQQMFYLSSQDSNCNLAATQGRDTIKAQKKREGGDVLQQKADTKLISNFFKPTNNYNNQVVSSGRNLRYKDQIANSQLSGEWTTFVSGDTSLMQAGASLHHQPVQQMLPRMLIVTPKGERELIQTTSSNKKQRQSQRIV